MTVDGSTAPGKGVTVLHHGIGFVGDCDDIWSGNNATKINEGARAKVVGNVYVAGPRSARGRGCV